MALYKNKIQIKYNIKYIDQLILSDLSVGCLQVLTDIIWKVTVTWYAGHVFCKLIKFAQCVATFGATYSLVSLSIDRLDVIARPMNMNNVGKKGFYCCCDYMSYSLYWDIQMPHKAQCVNKTVHLLYLLDYH